MLWDFLHSTGRFEGKIELYTKADLQEGLAFAEWLEELGEKKWPLFNFSIKKFKIWALKGGGRE
jgi:hypothetical protein